MLLMLQFWYNLSFKGFGLRPVVYIFITNVWGSVETSIEEFWRSLWVFSCLVLLVDSFAPVVSRFMGDVFHFFESTRTCISNTNSFRFLPCILTPTPHAHERNIPPSRNTTSKVLLSFSILTLRNKSTCIWCCGSVLPFAQISLLTFYV